jgi:hypothetical protein
MGGCWEVHWPPELGLVAALTTALGNSSKLQQGPSCRHTCSRQLASGTLCRDYAPRAVLKRKEGVKRTQHRDYATGKCGLWAADMLSPHQPCTCSCSLAYAADEAHHIEPTYWTTNRWGAPARPNASLGVGGLAAVPGTLEAKK